MSDDPTRTQSTYWNKRRPRVPLPHDQAARQGDITRIAFQILGREGAIAFLNTENLLLGGRPIALATESRAGQLHVQAELGRMQERQANAR